MRFKMCCLNSVLKFVVTFQRSNSLFPNADESKHISYLFLPVLYNDTPLLIQYWVSFSTNNTNTERRTTVTKHEHGIDCLTKIVKPLLLDSKNKAKIL